jgi:hypothetical protein
MQKGTPRTELFGFVENGIFRFLTSVGKQIIRELFYKLSSINLIKVSFDLHILVVHRDSRV